MVGWTTPSRKVFASSRCCDHTAGPAITARTRRPRCGAAALRQPSRSFISVADPSEVARDSCAAYSPAQRREKSRYSRAKKRYAISQRQRIGAGDPERPPRCVSSQETATIMAEWARRGRAINTDGAHSRASTASTTASRADRRKLEHVDRRVLRRVDVCSGPLGRGAYGIVWKGVERRGSRRPVV